MFAALLVENNRNKSIIAFHKKKDIIIKYCKNANRDIDDKNCKVFAIKIENKKAKQFQDYEDLYLVRYGQTYIQSKYLETHQLDSDTLIDDLKYTRDILYRIIEFNTNKKDIKTLTKAIEIVEHEIDIAKGYTPSIKELVNRFHHYEEYKNTIY